MVNTAPRFRIVITDITDDLTGDHKEYEWNYGQWPGDNSPEVEITEEELAWLKKVDEEYDKAQEFLGSKCSEYYEFNADYIDKEMPW